MVGIVIDGIIMIIYTTLDVTRLNYGLLTLFQLL